MAEATWYMLKAEAANSSQPLPMTTLHPCSGGFGHVCNMPAVIATLAGRDAIVIH